MPFCIGNITYIDNQLFNVVSFKFKQIRSRTFLELFLLAFTDQNFKLGTPILTKTVNSTKLIKLHYFYKYSLHRQYYLYDNQLFNVVSLTFKHIRPRTFGMDDS